MYSAKDPSCLNKPNLILPIYPPRLVLTICGYYSNAKCLFLNKLCVLLLLLGLDLI